MSQVTIRIAPADGSRPRVGFFETEANGTGDTWRAAAWMATVAASLASGVDLGQYVPSFTVDGRIDGPSAGALLAVGLISALQGRELPPDATMTGAIGPDGTIVPVAGVVHKLEAAKRSRKRLLLIPRGQQHDISHYTNQPVDLVAYGQTLGIEVREVDDLATAYQLLTGHRLGPAGRADREPSLRPDVRSALAEQTSDWLGLYGDRMRACQRLCETLGGAVDIDEELAEARAAADRARTLASAGAAAAAHDHAIMAALHAAVLEEALEGVQGVAAEGLGAIHQRLAAVGMTGGSRDDVVARTSSLPLSSLDTVLAVGDAYGIVAQADGLRFAAERILEDLGKRPDGASELDFLLKAAVIIALDKNVLQIAEDRLRLTVAGQSGKTAPVPDWDRLTAWAETLERAAEASLSYFEAVCLDDSAREMGLHPDLLRESMACRDLTYLLARSSLQALPSLKEEAGDRADVAGLGASIGVYAAASALIAKFYSLRVQINDQGDVVGVEDEAGLDRMLALSDHSARAAIGAARARGAGPTLPTYYYLVGRTYAQGDTLEKLEALQCYWQAGLSARIAVLVTTRPH